MSDQIDFTHLPDLRDLLSGKSVAYRGILSIQTPVVYSGDHNENSLYMNGIDVLLCVIRHLYCQMPPDFSGDPKFSSPAVVSKIRGEYEEINPLLRLAWSDLKRTDTCISAQNNVRCKIAKFLEQSPGVSGLSFMELVESPIMHRTLFSTECFQLFDRMLLSQLISEDMAAAPPGVHVPTNNEWDAEDAWADPVASAKASLVTWDGQGDLANFISDKFGLFTSQRVKSAYFWQGNRGAIIRVLYKAPLENPQTYSQLRMLKIEDKSLIIPDETQPKSFLREASTGMYVLTTVVRLRMKPDENDLLRRYGYEGQRLLEEVGWQFSRDDWRLGEPGRQYFLFYAYVEDQMPTANLPEVLKEPRKATNRVAENYRWLENACGESSGDT